MLALTVMDSPIRVLFLSGVLFGSQVMVASGTGSPFSNVKKSFGDAPWEILTLNRIFRASYDIVDDMFDRNSDC